MAASHQRGIPLRQGYRALAAGEDLLGEQRFAQGAGAMGIAGGDLQVGERRVPGAADSGVLAGAAADLVGEAQAFGEQAGRLVEMLVPAGEPRGDEEAA